DGNQNIVYSNTIGETILAVFHDVTSGNNWITFNKFDSSARVILHAEPSAVTGYDETKADLLNLVSGNYQYLSDSSGLIDTYIYGASTTATSSSAGDVTGYLKDVKLQKGETGTAILQSEQQYFSQTGASTIYPIATRSVYRNTDGTGAETTSYSYTWFTGTTQMQSMTVTKPLISTSQNGPGGTANDTESTYFDTYGRPIWHKEGDGFLNYTEYDQNTGAVTKTIIDVDTTRTSDFSNLPTGWSTPSGGDLHLI